MLFLYESLGAFVRMMEKDGAFLLILDIQTLEDRERLCLADFRSSPDEEDLKNAYFPDKQENCTAYFKGNGIDIELVKSECARMDGTFEFEALSDGSSTVQLEYHCSPDNRLGMADLADWLAGIIQSDSKAELVVNRYFITKKYSLTRSSQSCFDKTALVEKINRHELEIRD